jgi:hypothetical protein
MAEDRWKWGNAMLKCVAEIRTRRTSSCAFVDEEVMPRFDGRPDDMFVWFICRTRTEKEAFRKAELRRITKALKESMSRAGFPDDAIASLSTDVTSLEDIEDGGGRFYFFR